MSFGYGFFYLYIAVFVQDQNMTLLYIFPMMIIVTLWQDLFYTIE